jgi:hypothetical protein
MNRYLRQVLLFLALVALASAPAWGQAGTSTIRGTVTDQQGGVIPNAKVTITHLGTGFTRNQLTSATGSFGFELIPVGEYKVEVEAQGFQKKVVSPVRAMVGSAADASVQLEIGAMTQVVQVEASPSVVQVNTQDATLGNNILGQQITGLPMEARNIQALLTLQPAVTRQGYVAGARSDQSNLTLDGVDINEAQTNALGSPVLRLNSEAIAEFRVTTLNPNANQGRSSAAQVNLVTKSGSNAFHGSAFWYHRNTIFTANDFFSNRAGVDRPKLLRNTFGGTIGGPIKKEKLFFFYSYEGRTDASATSVVQIVPLASMGQGQLRYRTTGGTVVTLTNAQVNAAFPAVGTNPAALAALAAAAAAYPANDYTQGDSTATSLLNTAAYRFNAPTPVDMNSNVARMDWNISSNQTLYVRVNAIYDLRTQAPWLPGAPSPDRWDHPWGIAVSHNLTFGKSWVNSFRYGLTRQAYSDMGDSATNCIGFRFVYWPDACSRTLSRVTPVHNLINDTSWVKGSHTINFGTNIRLIRNSRMSLGNAYDAAVTNPSFYQNSGTVVSDVLSAYLAANALPPLVSVAEAQNAATALIGRYSQYTARFTFDRDGTLLPSGTPTDRTFATEEYDFYFQDTWKLTRNLTFTYGLRYGLSRPVYEKNGFEVKPDISTSEYLRRRIQDSYQGLIYDRPLILDLSGPANNKSPLYNWDKNNFQPRVSIAWSPHFENSFLGSVFGRAGQSVLRAGYAITNDYYGQALAVLFDLNNTLGFVSNTTISANTYNVTTRPAPLFTGYTQAIRPLPGITVPGDITFPREQPSNMWRRIETGLDSELQAPINYMWNFTFERELPAGMVVQASYIGRMGRHLLADRDVMALNNLRDPISGMDWNTAATQLEILRATRPPGSTVVTPIAYFENMFPSNLRDILNAYYGGSYIPAGFTPTQSIFYVMNNWYGNDWTYIQDDIDESTGTNYFFNPQYGALSAWGTIANSNYHGFSLSVRQRYRGLLWDFNYTWSHSLDDASGLQSEASWAGGFILNPLRQHDNYASSDFDMRHMINVNAIYELPFGRGKLFGSNAPGWADQVIGGWRLSGIFRWNTGLPLTSPYDDARWATNWQVQSNVTRTTDIQPCFTMGDASNAPKFFGCNTTEAYQSFRNAYPGETGERNTFRLPGYIVLDMGINKAFNLSRVHEGMKMELRWEVFNVTNTQHFGNIDGSRTGWGMRLDPKVRNLTPPANWSNFTEIQGSPRVMQIGLRIEF